MTKLSEYEQLRLNNIRRNEEALAALGFDVTEKKTNTKKTPAKPKTKRKRVDEDYDEEDEEEEEEVIQPRRRSARIAGAQPLVPGTRSSTRIRSRGNLSTSEVHPPTTPTLPGHVLVKTEHGLVKVEVPGVAEPSLDLDPSSFQPDPLADEPDRVKVTAQSVIDHIRNHNPYHLKYFSNDDINHCIYRMSYMSSKKLLTRLNTIIRCCGKKAHAKLLIFYYCLKCSKLENLAQIAHQALEKRLHFDMTDYE